MFEVLSHCKQHSQVNSRERQQFWNDDRDILIGYL